MDLWELMVSILWFMLLVAWFTLLIRVLTDVFRDPDLSGWAKAGWCTFVIVLPWLGVLVYLIARGRSMAERTYSGYGYDYGTYGYYAGRGRDARMPDGGIAAELTRLAEMRDQGLVTPQEYEQAKARVLGTAPAAPMHDASVAG